MMGRHDNERERQLEQLVEQYTLTLRELRRAADEMATFNGIRRRGALARPLLGGANAKQKISVSPGVVTGWSIRDTAATGITVYLRDGVDASGDIIAVLVAPVSGSVPPPASIVPIGFTIGLFVDVAFGTPEGVVYIAPAAL